MLEFVYLYAHIVISVSWKWEVAETCLELVHQVANRIWATLPLQYDRDPQTLVFGPGIWEGWGGWWRVGRGRGGGGVAQQARIFLGLGRHSGAPGCLRQ